jgi:hypothetical protein
MRSDPFKVIYLFLLSFIKKFLEEALFGLAHQIKSISEVNLM